MNKYKILKKRKFWFKTNQARKYQKKNGLAKINQRIPGVGFRNAQCIKKPKNNKLNSEIGKDVVQNIQYGLFKTSCIYL